MPSVFIRIFELLLSEYVKILIIDGELVIKFLGYGLAFNMAKGIFGISKLFQKTNNPVI